MPLDILIVRDPRESIAKCSLTPLRGVEGVRFVHFKPKRGVAGAGRILLTPDGELLSEADRGRGILLIDCSWRRVQQVLGTVEGEVVHRRLPELTTAYPRRSKTHEDPATGLASIEALYAASVILGEPGEHLLDCYRWRDEFLSANPDLPSPDRPR
jgi:ribosome biogenesis protein Tsr3